MEASSIETIMTRMMRPIMGSCEETRDQLSDHLEGSVPPKRERRVTRHLRYCRRCRSIYESLVETVGRVRMLGREGRDAPADESVVGSVIERIRRENL